MTEPQYEVACWYCLAEFDGIAAVWCACSSTSPNKVCPFCLRCACAGGREIVERFWHSAPAGLAEQRRSVSTRRLPLGDMLVAAGRITATQLDEALQHQARTGRRLGNCLVDLGHLATTDLDRLLGEQQAPVAFDLGSRTIDPELCRTAGVAFCLEKRVVPIERTVVNGNPIVLLAMADPSVSTVVDQVQRRLQARVVVGRAPESEITELLARLFPDTICPPAETTEPRASTVQSLLRDALRAGASHLQLRERSGRLQMYWAVDGVLHPAPEADSVHIDLLDALLARFADAPRGGGLRVEAGEGRALAYPHTTGDRGSRTTTVRFFLFDDLQTSIESLGLDPESRFAVHRSLSASSGLVLLAGPAGSGCETTLWSFLNEIALTGRQIALFNSPLAHPAENIHEGPLAVGSALEDAPDPLPECRWDIDALALYRCDNPSALARAARESERRLVLVRIPESSASDALAHVLASGTTAEALSARLALVVEQRALRRICSRCFETDTDATATLVDLGDLQEDAAPVATYHGRGCETCGVGAGYRGRVPLIQVLPACDVLRRVIRNGDLRRVGELPRAHGETGPEALCLDLLRQGVTTPAEVRRVLGASPMPVSARTARPSAPEPHAPADVKQGCVS